ncbi:MAG: hypothetical protein RMK84_00635 [Oscillochloridaceae bacterium]|nr:hypothetical protein [Chloroflexaceae bacterium]MDW8388602.1 hypothetical protein [Oscillochloridaceae bacterium]
MAERKASFALLSLLLAAGLILAALTRDAPLARWDGLLRADALSALLVIVVAAHGLVTLAHGAPRPWRVAMTAWLVGASVLQGHLAALGGLLVLAGLLEETGSDEERPIWRLAPVGVVAGLALIGLTGGAWNYGAPLAGAGLNSLSFVLILVSALLAPDALALAGTRAPASASAVAGGCLYTLMRLFSLGPWNTGWLFAALLMGGLVALWGAWRAAIAPAERAAPWLGLSLSGMTIAGAGMGSAAGLTVAGYILLLWPVLRLGLERPAAGMRALWLLSAAVPLSGPFVAGWLAIAAATAGGLPALALVLWLAALLIALPPARLALAPAAPSTGDGRTWLAAGCSAGLGLGAPLLLMGLLAPLTAQLQGGLTPFGEIVVWPWAGLIAFDTAQQPVATLPSLAIVGLMLILSALCWVALRLLALRKR